MTTWSIWRLPEGTYITGRAEGQTPEEALTGVDNPRDGGYQLQKADYIVTPNDRQGLHSMRAAIVRWASPPPVARGVATRVQL